MKIFTIACFCIFSTIVCKAIEKDSREIKYAAVRAEAALVLFHSVAFVKDLISVFEDLFILSGIDDMYLTILFKSLGICYIVQLASDYCKDNGLPPLDTYSIDYVDNDKNFVKSDWKT